MFYGIIWLHWKYYAYQYPSYKKHLTIAQQLMLTLLEEEPAGIIEFKGKQYIKKGIPQND